MDSPERGAQEYSDEVGILLAHAHERQAEGDYASATSLYQGALALLPADDPRRPEIEATIERLNRELDRTSRKTPRIIEEPTRVRWWIYSLVGCLLVTLLILTVGMLGYLAFFSPFSSPQVSVSFPSPTPLPTFVLGLPPTKTPSVSRTASPPALAPSPLASTATPLPNPETLVPESTLIRPTLVTPQGPTVAPTAQQANVTFDDTFSGASLDLSIWVLENNAETTVRVSNGILRLGSSSTHFPYLHTRSDPFPDSGNFQVDVHFRYASQGVCGVPIGMASYLLPVGLTQNEANARSISAENNGMAIWLWHSSVQYRADGERPEIPISNLNSDWHLATIIDVGGRYFIALDGLQVFASEPTPARPVALWLGHPIELGSGFSCPWDTLEVSEVRVQAMP